MSTNQSNRQKSDTIRYCPKGHPVSFGYSSPGAVVCTCKPCNKRTRSIYRGHALTQHEAYLRYLVAVASW